MLIDFCFVGETLVCLRPTKQMNKQKNRNRNVSRKIKTIISIFGRQRRWIHFTTFAFLLAAATVNSSAQTSPPFVPQVSPTPATQTTPKPPSPSLERQFLKNILRDQKVIWTSPFRLRGEEAKWLAPLAATTAGLVATDRRTPAIVGRSGSLSAVSRGASLGGKFYVTGGVVAAEYRKGIVNEFRRLEEEIFGKKVNYETLVLKFQVERWWKGKPVGEVILVTNQPRDPDGTEHI
jgi:hypothetical protein